MAGIGDVAERDTFLVSHGHGLSLDNTREYADINLKHYPVVDLVHSNLFLAIFVSLETKK